MSPARSLWQLVSKRFGLNNDRSIFLVCNVLYGQIVVALPRNLILTDENIKIYRYKLNSETASLRTLTTLSGNGCLYDRALTFLVVVSNERLQEQCSKSGKCH